MPKEISHWVLAERTTELLPPGPIRTAIESFPAYYYLGAVIYDSPFYAIGIAQSEVYDRIADRLHGVTGEDTFQPYRDFIAGYSEGLPLPAVSFIAGALTHYCGDVTFHPLVNHFSGKYAADEKQKRYESQSRHRGLEGHMDLFFSGVFQQGRAEILATARRGGKLGNGLRNNGRLRSTLRSLASERDTVEDIVRRFYGPECGTLPIWPLLQRHGQLQKQFFRRFFCGLLGALGRILGGGPQVIASTFYPIGYRRRAVRNPESTLPFFASPIVATHPNTGEVLKGTIEDFAARMTTRGAELIGSLQACIERGEERTFLQDERAESLEYGCDAGRYPEPVHFNQEQPISVLCRHPFRHPG